jgi:hypothetical protein
MGRRHHKGHELAWHPRAPNDCAVASAPDGAVAQVILHTTAASMHKHDRVMIGQQALRFCRGRCCWPQWKPSCGKG